MESGIREGRSPHPLPPQIIYKEIKKMKKKINRKIEREREEERI